MCLQRPLTPECLSPQPGQAKTSLGSRRRPVLPSRSCSPGAQAAGDTVMGRGTGSCSPRTAATLGPGLSPLNSPPWTCPPQGTIFFRERGGMFAPFWIDTRGGSVHPPPSTPQPRALLASPASWRAKVAGPAPSHRCLGCGSVLGLLTEPRRAGDGAQHWLCPGARHPASPHLCLCSPLQRHLRNAQSLLS